MSRHRKSPETSGSRSTRSSPAMSSRRRPSGTSIRIAGRCTGPRGASISGSACPRCSSPSTYVFHNILIANRGEVAVGVMRTCREMGIRTVLAHSTADAQSLPVRLADETICIGPDAARASYLNMPAVISAAVVTDSEAIHPGYGFLAENPTFADICRASGLTFIGPSPEAIRLMGDKAQARMIAKQAGVPVVPGSELPLKNEAEALDVPDEAGYPVIFKPSADHAPPPHSLLPPHTRSRPPCLPPP